VCGVDYQRSTIFIDDQIQLQQGKSPHRRGAVVGDFQDIRRAKVAKDRQANRVVNHFFSQHALVTSPPGMQMSQPEVSDHPRRQAESQFFQIDLDIGDRQTPRRFGCDVPAIDLMEIEQPDHANIDRRSAHYEPRKT